MERRRREKGDGIREDKSGHLTRVDIYTWSTHEATKLPFIRARDKQVCYHSTCCSSLNMSHDPPKFVTYIFTCETAVIVLA
jgi:hypothetical protein